ncbi:MAG: DUF2934 domain-containing protein [Alphaproteobacteria bacterium]|nr:DUF2934 domain-containing protein [Alphaproteobacteria bacterium]
MTKKVTDQMLRETAYYLWEQAGRPEGTGEEFWLQACAQLLGEEKEPSKKATTKKVKKTQKK